MSSRSSKWIYDDRRWRVVRRAALVRDQYQCQLKLPGCTGRATQGDHTLAIEDGGAPFSLTNAQASCRHCNVAKENERRLTRLAAKAHTPSRTW